MSPSLDVDRYNSFDFAPTPAMLVDIYGIIRRLNVAFRFVFGDECAGCCGHHHTVLSARIVSPASTSLLPKFGMTMRRAVGADEDTNIAFQTTDLQAETHKVHINSLQFGRMLLDVTEIPQVSQDDGRWLGSTVWLETAQDLKSHEYCKVIHEALSHELLWDLYASSYDQILPAMFFYKEALDRHCDILAHSSIRTVIDIGAGTGLQLKRLLTMGKTVTAVEISRAMLAKLRSRVANPATQAFAVIEQSAESLPQLRAGTFDAATILLAFFDMQDPWKALREAQRLIVPGGLLVFTEPRASFDVDELMQAGKESLISAGTFATLEPAWNRIETVAPLIRKRIANAQECAISKTTPVLWNAEAAYEVLKQEGYHNLTIVDSHLGNCATVRGTKP